LPESGIIFSCEIQANLFIGDLAEIKAHLSVIFYHGEFEKFLVSLIRKGIFSGFHKNTVHNIPEKSDVIQQGAIPVPDDMLIFFHAPFFIS
jgi:RNA:NAD 2'-phosphotransferase (TPT1/KptA family)